jgi:glycosyltransferase involved in cell wall biosynthesis
MELQSRISGLLKDIKHDMFPTNKISLNFVGSNEFSSFYESSLDKDYILYESKSNTINIVIVENIMLYRPQENDKIIIIYNTFAQMKNYISLKMKNNICYCINTEYYSSFLKHFYYYIENDIFNYDNLFHLTMIVKDAGDQFRHVLTENLPYIDRWTILDTGSTDNTISIINDVLKNKKGNLYQEEFKGFKNSRNRCLDLAGDSCVFKIMLDDTYIIKGNLRSFLTNYRFDKNAESFSIYIKTDVQYVSNRITYSKYNLRYIYDLHEVIEPNQSYLIPENISYITENDDTNNYMKNRTIKRKESDLKILFDEYNKNPSNHRHPYYIAETYLCMERWKEAFEWYEKRSKYQSDLVEETQDSLYKMAFISEILNYDWKDTCQLYLNAFQFMPTRPESMYMLGEHYLKTNQLDVAFLFYSKAFECLQYINDFQMNVKINMYHNHVPFKLLSLCYPRNTELGLRCCKHLLDHSTIPLFKSIASNWQLIFHNLLKILPNQSKLTYKDNKKLITFVMEGGWDYWNANSLKNKGIGGSETFIIKYAYYLHTQGFECIVFCNCIEVEVCNGVTYMPIYDYYKFASQYHIDFSLINRYTELLPVNYHYNINTYLILHDLFRENEILINNPLLKGVFCISNFHVDYTKQYFPFIKDITHYVSYGVEQNLLHKYSPNGKIPFSFIYSSFPNRGLIHLLRIFPKIVSKFPQAKLNIFCNLKLPFVQKHFKDEMDQIEILLSQQNNVTNHGWVNTTTLHSYWLQSQIWLYPCTFVETCCQTAYEAAATKTLVISNNLAALAESIGDRGIIISENPGSSTWESQVLFMLDKVFNQGYGSDLITKNYNWVSTKTYDKVVDDFAKSYLK